MHVFPRLFVSWIAFVAVSVAVARAQGGYTTEKHADLGINFPRANNYEAIPTQPDEEIVVLYYAEKPSKDPKERPKSMRPEMSVLWIDYVPDTPKPGATGGSGQGPAPGATGTGGDDSGEGRKAPPPVNTLERYVDQRLPTFGLSQPTDAKSRDGWTAREYTIAAKKGAGPSKVGGWALAYSKPGRTIAFLGMAPLDDMDKQIKIWRGMAEKADFYQPEEQSTAKLEQYYSIRKLLDVPYRIKVRQDLVRGWKAEDLDHYIVVYDTVDQPLMRKVFRDMEIIRKEYERLFPPDKPVTAVSTVRVCKSRNEYLIYGGIPGSAGYWNSETQELVLYNDVALVRDRKTGELVEDKKKGEADTFIVLYHEAFHQFIHYSAGELPPHSWFNEGSGDYFSGATIKDGKMRGIGVNPWRIEHIQNAIGENKTIPWADMIKFEQPQYYQKDRIGLCYAQGWSMIYFLRTCKDVAAKPEWAKILPTYFDVLRKDYAEACARLEGEGKKEDKQAHYAAGYEARVNAVDKAFEGVNLDDLEKAWSAYILTLKVPDSK